MRLAAIGVLSVGLLFSTGCSSQADRDRKRAEDRTAMQLSQALRDRDSYKVQIDKLEVALSDAQAKTTVAQQQLDAVRSQLKEASDQLQNVRSRQAAMEQMEQRVKNAQDALAQSERANADALKRIENLSQQKGDLDRKLASLQAASAQKAAAPAPATQVTK